MSGPFNARGDPNATLPLVEDIHDSPVPPATPEWTDSYWGFFSFLEHSMFPSPSPSGSPEPPRAEENTKDQGARPPTPPTSSPNPPGLAEESRDEATPPNSTSPRSYFGHGERPGAGGKSPHHTFEQASVREEGYACECDEPDDDYMVVCDNKDVHRGDLWFHYACAGLGREGPDLTNGWICWECVEAEDAEQRAALRKADDSNENDEPNESDAPNEPDDAPEHSESVRHGKRKRALTEEEQGDPRKKQRKAPQKPREQSEGSGPRSNTRSSQSKGTSAQAPDPAAQQTPARPAQTPVSAPKVNKASSSWSDAENNACIIEMRAIKGQYATMGDFQRANKSKLWEDLSNRLKTKHNIIRGDNAVKLQWSRVLRQLSGIDERSRPDANNLVTSAQTSSPKKRKAAPTAAATSANPATTNTSASSSAATSSNAAGSAAPRLKRVRRTQQEEEKEEEGDEGEEPVGEETYGDESEAYEEEAEAGAEQDAPTPEDEVSASGSDEGEVVDSTEARPGESDEDFARRLERRERLRSRHR